MPRTDRELFQQTLDALLTPSPDQTKRIAEVATLIEKRLAAGASHRILEDRSAYRAKDAGEAVYVAHPDLHDKVVRIRHTAVIEGPFPDVARQLGFSVPVGPCSGPVKPLAITIERSDFEVLSDERAPAHELDAMVRSESGHGGS
jgi:hypothetical protein